MRRLLVVMLLSTLCGCHSCGKEGKEKESETKTVEAEPSAKLGHRPTERAPGLHPKIKTTPIGHKLFHDVDAATEADAGH